MKQDQVDAMLCLLENMTDGLSKIANHMEHIVDKLDSIDSNLVYLGHTMEEIKEEEIS